MILKVSQVGPGSSWIRRLRSAIEMGHIPRPLQLLGRWFHRKTSPNSYLYDSPCFFVKPLLWSIEICKLPSIDWLQLGLSAHVVPESQWIIMIFPHLVLRHLGTSTPMGILYSQSTIYRNLVDLHFFLKGWLNPHQTQWFLLVTFQLLIYDTLVTPYIRFFVGSTPQFWMVQKPSMSFDIGNGLWHDWFTTGRPPLLIDLCTKNLTLTMLKIDCLR